MSAGPMVECPICEEEFDPTAAGGWCTNSDCGEWKHEGETVPDPTDAEAGPAGTPEPDDPQTPTADGPGEADDETPADDEPDAEDGLADEETDRAETGNVGAPGDEQTDVEAAEESAPELECPDCGNDLDPEVNFCPNCGEDVTSLEPGTAMTLTECPECGADVDEADNFCAACGEHLEPHRTGGGSGTESDAGEATAADPDDVTADTDTGEGRSPDTEDEAVAPESLILATRGEEIAVADGDTVGRDLRRVVTETGGDEDQAVRIHREHVRFVREEGQFYVVDLGQNPTRLNGRSMERGDREPVAPGDEIELSGIVELAVREP